jgi:hypothetical protein
MADPKGAKAKDSEPITPANDEGFLGLIDFNLLVLPHGNSVLRATCTQRECVHPDEISSSVEKVLARLLQMEVDFLEKFERMKT